jgi:hypothetical protein
MQAQAAHCPLSIDQDASLFDQAVRLVAAELREDAVDAQPLPLSQ